MILNLANYEAQARDAVKLFWRNREAAMAKQVEFDNQDAGARGAVTAGKNLDGFVSMVQSLVEANGLWDAEICIEKKILVLPGFYRPTKECDMLIMRRGQLVAALEFKSQVGPSFGNNFNNRSEEVMGSAHDLWTAYREGAFGDDAARPFLGWLMLVEECEVSTIPVKVAEPHFQVDPVFRLTSYIERYDILCKRLVQEGLYTSTALMVSPREAVDDGRHRNMSDLTSLKTFVTEFAGHVAAMAAR
ncbi:MAG: restriction endonuclease [Aestuariivita sp.]|nr:restriction endonuclease [Aestuariivita sp.]